MKLTVVTKEYELTDLRDEYGQYKSARLSKPAHTRLQVLQGHFGLSDAGWTEFLSTLNNKTAHLYKVLIPGLQGKEATELFTRDSDNVTLLHVDTERVLRVHNMHAPGVFELDDSGVTHIYVDETLELLDELRERGEYHVGRALRVHLSELAGEEPGEWIELLEYASACFG